MSQSASPFPNYMVERFRAWRATKFENDKAWYAQLVDEGQRPRAMVISCCDSRVDAGAMLGAEPGDLFMVRNVANLAPPYAPDHEHHGTSAAIEFAVTGLKVAHIVVLGHAQCGGVKACLDQAERKAEGQDEDTSFVGRWIDILTPALSRVTGEDRAARQMSLEQEGVLTSLANLESFPFVREAMEKGRLTLHGGWFDIGHGALHVYDRQRDAFVPV